jgi:ABC-type Mn2+/Zn2+ transport system ATPase subunit
LRVLQILLDAVARLGLVVALLFLVEDPRAASLVAIGATLATAARYAIRGSVMDRETRAAWSSVLGALRSKDVRALETLREDQAGSTLIFDSVREVAIFRASTVPDVVAAVLVALGLVGLLVARVSLVWLGVGAVSSLVVLAVLLPALRRQRRAQLRGFATIGPVARDFQALIGAAAELRATGSEAAFARRLEDLVGRQADAEREALRYGALHASVPAVLAGVAAFVPRSAVDALGASGRLFDLGVLAAALLTSLLTLIRAVESARQARPYLDVVSKLSPGGVLVREGPRSIRSLVLDRVTVNHAGGAVAPKDLSFRLERGGLAILGANGTGKSTAVRVALGLLGPDTGTVSVDGEELRGPLASDRVAYLPQRPYVDRSEPLAFHLRLVGIEPSEPWIMPALDRAGLGPLLTRRSAATPLEAPLGTLSGGEAQRFFIARTLGRPADLVVLDEPEVGLDTPARERLRSWLADVAEERPVLLVAHDEAVVPSSFVVLRLEHDSRSPLGA